MLERGGWAQAGPRFFAFHLVFAHPLQSPHTTLGMSFIEIIKNRSFFFLSSLL